MQDWVLFWFSIIVECRKDDTWLIGALLQCSWIEGKCTHWSSYCDVVGCRVMIRACLGKRHIVVEVVGTECCYLPGFCIKLINTGFSYYPNIALVIFYHTLNQSLVEGIILHIRYLEVVLQQISAFYLFENTTKLTDEYLSARVL